MPIDALTITEIDAIETLASTPVDELIEFLKHCDELYYNGGDSPIDDNTYDLVRSYTQTLDPVNVYFTGVGSSVRGGKQKLPYTLGSLNQVDIGHIQQWVIDNKLADAHVVVSDKMDGTSAMLIYDEDGHAQIAFSRGDGFEGADISRHIFQINNVPKKVEGKLVVRAEVELTETAFESLRSHVKTKSGKLYKNARNMVSGLMNSKTIPDIAYKYLTVIAYEVIDSSDDKWEQFKTLERNGFQVAWHERWTGRLLTDDNLASHLLHRREYIDYAIDGLVLDVDAADTRKAMCTTDDDVNPPYSVKYKVADASNLAVATVTDVILTISKHGYVKPTIEIEPVDLVGVTVTHCTGFNMKYIYDNKIGPGCTINITRSGDVIPFCLGVVESGVSSPELYEEWFSAHLHSVLNGYAYTWTDTGVDVRLVSNDGNKEVAIQQTLDFFKSINAPMIREGSVRKMFEANAYQNSEQAIIQMLICEESVWTHTLGVNGSKAFNGLREKLQNIQLFEFLGALPCFGRGVGKRRFKVLLDRLHITDINDVLSLTKSNIESIHGFQTTTAEKIIKGLDYLQRVYSSVECCVRFVEVNPVGNKLQGKNIVLSGFRDKELSEYITSEGGEVKNNISKNTSLLIIKDRAKVGSKEKKAHKYNVSVCTLAEFKQEHNL